MLLLHALLVVSSAVLALCKVLGSLDKSVETEHRLVVARG